MMDLGRRVQELELGMPLWCITCFRQYLARPPYSKLVPTLNLKIALKEPTQALRQPTLSRAWQVSGTHHVPRAIVVLRDRHDLA